MDLTLQGFAQHLRGLSRPELRKDPIVGRWVIIAPDRAQRPVAAVPEPEPSTGPCPFCEGNEHATPPEVLSRRAAGTQPNTPGWRVRVVPNKFPALHRDSDVPDHTEALAETRSAFGSHEVIVECPHHETSLTTFSEEHLREILAVYRERLVALKAESRLVHATVFKNSGTAAGASVAHAHSQLIATPLVPLNILEELTGAGAYFERQGRCVFCELIRQELTVGARIVLDTPRYVCLTPFASRFSFEMWVLPKQHGSHYEDIQPAEVAELATVLRTALRKLEATLSQPAYNYLIHTAPFDTRALPHYHWHLEILPRLTRVAGFEWGTGFCINSVPPELAAEFLRNSG